MNGTRIKPLFLFQAVKRHRKRLESQPGLRTDLRALWKYTGYHISGDNGKNYQSYANLIGLFEALYQIFAQDETVDMALCLYGFDRLSNLGNYYRMYPEEEQHLPLPLSIEDLLLEHECAFSCFEHGYGDNVILSESGLSHRKLERLTYSKKPDQVRLLQHLEKYLNENLQSDTERFLNAERQEVRPLCEEILSGAHLPEEFSQKSEKKRNIVLAAINAALMEAVDDVADQVLTAACHELVGDNLLEEGKK